MSQLITTSETEFKSKLFKCKQLDKCEANLKVGMKIEYKRLESVKKPVDLTEHWKLTMPNVEKIKDGLTDFTFHVSGKDFNVHKSILAKSCKAMKDAMESKNDKTIVDIKNPYVFETVLLFYYGKKEMFERNVEKFISQVYDAAERYRMEDLKQYCVDVIIKKCMDKNRDDLFKAYRFAHANELDGLKEYCWEIIKL